MLYNSPIRLGARTQLWSGGIPTQMTTLIVDCGSGLTRAAVFWRDAGNRVHACEASASTGQAEPFALPRIVDVLTEGGSALHRWVASIQELVVATGCTSTVIGATGGLRQAEAAGRVTPRMLASLGELLRELVPAAEFRSLSGEDEARAELGAVQHVADLTLPPSVPRPIGMLSGGGMTSQASGLAVAARECRC